jgi:hypothetical protein
MATAHVQVSRGFLIGVVTVAAGSLLALAFVLGRESSSGSAPAPPTKIERIAPRAPEQPLPPPARVAAASRDYADTRPASALAPTIPAQGAAPQPGAEQASAPNETERGNAGIDPMRAAVAAYFDAVERIQVGSMSGEAESVGREMATALASGDTSSLDKMIRETEAAKVSLAAVIAPAPCAAHHRECLGSLDDALEVLRSLKAAMESSEPVSQLANVTARAQALRSRADVLQKEELALRERYGLRR